MQLFRFERKTYKLKFKAKQQGKRHRMGFGGVEAKHSVLNKIHVSQPGL